MSAPEPLEAEYLRPAESALTKGAAKDRSSTAELRLQILEAASARFGGFDLAAYHEAFEVEPQKDAAKLLELAAPVVSAIERSPIRPALALSALAREVLLEKDRKTTGAYHTDFRLATRLAQLAAPRLTYKSTVIDPASGAGILLAALTQAVCGMDRTKAAYWLAHGVSASDLSRNSLRGALLSLASFTDDLHALKLMRTRWHCGDSLMADTSVWSAMAPRGFDAVIGNPPWEKLKLSRHEFLKSSGVTRDYGTKIYQLDQNLFAAQRDEVFNYSRQLLKRYPDLRNGEPDLYIAFTDLFFGLCKEQGTVAALVPGGLIRSQGTQAIRRKIFDACKTISLSVIDNRARFFGIDTRFKFLAVALTKGRPGESEREPIRLLHERGTATGLETTGAATIGRSALESIRPDLSLPEVRSVAEWKLYRKLSSAGVSWNGSGSPWAPKFCREVDMTKERPRFLSSPGSDALPVIEGRMVQAHRFGVKGHVSGSGRSAVWRAYSIGNSQLSPQYWIRSFDVPPGNRYRSTSLRAGFCDIAGQTNERSLMAALIPPGVVCGNKVPTIIFPEDQSESRLLVWVAVANSFVFDWMLRRVLTTTVNYFLLQSLPMPKLAADGLPWRKLENAARELRACDVRGASRATRERIATLRSDIDAEVAVAYGLDLKDMELVLHDFPILDRGQAALPGETKSTVTRDTVLAAMAKRTKVRSSTWPRRVSEAMAIGAIAYVPSELEIGGVGVEEGTPKYG